MEEQLIDKFSEYERLLGTYEKIGINVEKEKAELNELRNSFTEKRVDTFKEALENLSNHLQEDENYYYILTTTRYLKSIINNHDNIEEHVSCVLKCLNIIETCNKEKILKENSMLSEFYLMVLEISKLEILYSKEHKSTLIEYITQRNNQIHITKLAEAIEQNVKEIRNSTYAKPKSLNDLDRTINKKMMQGPQETLIDEEIIKKILATINFDTLRKTITESLKTYLYDIESVNKELDKYKSKINELEFDRNRHQVNKKSSQKALSKILAGLLGIVTPLSILYYKNNDNLSKLISDKNTVYETTTLKLSQNDITSEAYQNILQTVTWEEKQRYQATRTLEVLDEVKIIDGKLKRDYKIYDISSYSFDLELTNYIDLYNNGEISDDFLIKSDTRTCSPEEYKYSDIIVTQTIQDLDKEDKIEDENNNKTTKIVLYIIGALVDLSITIYAIMKITEYTKSILINFKNSKLEKKQIETNKNNMISLLTTNRENISRYQNLCRDLLDILDETELTNEDKELLEELHTLIEKEGELRRTLKIK